MKLNKENIVVPYIQIRSEYGIETNFLNRSVNTGDYVFERVVRRPLDVANCLIDIYMLSSNNAIGYITDDGHMFVEVCICDELKEELIKDMQFCCYHLINEEKLNQNCSIYQFECNYNYNDLNIPSVLYFLSKTSDNKVISHELFIEDRIREEYKNYNQQNISIISVDCSKLPVGSVFPSNYQGIYEYYD